MLSEMHLQSLSNLDSYCETGCYFGQFSNRCTARTGGDMAYPIASGDENEASFNMVNSLFTRIHFIGEIFSLPDKHFSADKLGIKCYKEHWTYIATAIPFYLLGVNSYSSGWACVGYKTDNGKYLAVWR